MSSSTTPPGNPIYEAADWSSVTISIDALRPDLVGPFNTQQLTGLGEHLTRTVLDAPDEGHRSDMVATNRWAEELRLTGWFEWQPFEQSR